MKLIILSLIKKWRTSTKDIADIIRHVLPVAINIIAKRLPEIIPSIKDMADLVETLPDSIKRIYTSHPKEWNQLIKFVRSSYSILKKEADAYFNNDVKTLLTCDSKRASLFLNIYKYAEKLQENGTMDEMRDTVLTEIKFISKQSELVRKNIESILTDIAEEMDTDLSTALEVIMEANKKQKKNKL